MATDQQDTTIPPRPWVEVCESGDWWVNTDNAEAFDGGWVCDSNPGIFRNQATLDFMLKAVNARDGLVAAVTIALAQNDHTPGCKLAKAALQRCTCWKAIAEAALAGGGEGGAR